MMATVNDQTPNFALELPHPQNHMPEDCTRIRNSLIKVDSQLKKLNGVTDAKLDKTGGMLTGDLLLKSSNLARTPAGDIVNAWGDGCIRLLEKAGLQVGFLHVGEFATFGYVTALGHSREINGKNVDSLIRVCIDPDGTTYATCPSGRGLYNTDIVNFNNLVDYAPKKLGNNTKTYHVNANTGSDTTDLYNGRGESADRPFKTLSALFNYLAGCVGSYAIIILHSDISWAGEVPRNFISRLEMKSDETRRNITIGKDSYFSVADNNILLIDVKFTSSGSNGFIYANGYNGNPVIQIANIEFSGAVNKAAISTYGTGTVLINSNITGAVTGKRYSCTSGGRILTGGKGPNAIPGTEAGSCDASSVYA